MKSVVILGSGQAGLQAAASLRSGAYEGAITIIGRESGLPYQRPPLSKAVLDGRVNASQLELQPLTYFSDNRIELIDGGCASAVDRVGNTITLESGESIGYTHLIFAIGARNRVLPWAAEDIDGLLYLRTKEDAAELKRRMDRALNIVIVGAGFLGLEFATAAAAGGGRTITVVELGECAMGRAVSKPVADYFTRKHISRGVSFLFGETIASLLEKNDHVAGVITRSGTVLPADLILVAVGVMPNTELASQAGLRVSNGIVVDSTLRTSDPAISAIGDCATFPFDGQPVRLESVQNAIDHGKFIADAITGVATHYGNVPLFWSEQCGSRLQISGLSKGSDLSIVRGDNGSDKFSVFHFKSGKLLAVEAVNSPGDYVIARKMFKLQISPRPEEAADVSFDLRNWVSQQS